MLTVTQKNPFYLGGPPRGPGEAELIITPFRGEDTEAHGGRLSCQSHTAAKPRSWGLHKSSLAPESRLLHALLTHLSLTATLFR